MAKKTNTISINESQLRNLIGEVLSEAIDELNLYHGTNADFDNFDVAHMSTGWGKQAHGYGFYLIDNFDAAKEYAYDNKNGQVLKVEVPDGRYLTNRSISSREKQDIANKLFRYLTVENEDTRESYEDEDSKKCLWEYEIKAILGCSDGEWVYGTVSSILGEDSETSKFLHDKCGYVGLKLLDKDTKDTTYVIFDQNDIKIIQKNVLNEKINKEDLNKFRTTFTFGKYNGQDKVKIILEDPEYCVWLYKKMRYCPFTDNQLGLLDVSYYKKYKVFPIKSRKTPKYAQIRGVLVKDMTAEQLQYVYEHGSDEFKWLVKIEHINRGWSSILRPYKRYPVFQTDDLYESIEKTDDNSNGRVSTGQDATDWAVGKFGVFRLSNHMLSCIYEAAFQLLGFERFAINGEITFGDIMDNPWDDAYHIIDWAVANKGLDKKYLGRVSSLFSGMSNEQFRAYCDRVNSGKEFMFSREDLSEIFKALPDKLRRELVKDVINVGRINEVREMVEYLKNMNGGKNLEEFVNIMKNEYRNGNIERGKIANIKEPVRKAMIGSRMISQ